MHDMERREIHDVGLLFEYVKCDVCNDVGLCLKCKMSYIIKIYVVHVDDEFMRVQAPRDPQTHYT